MDFREELWIWGQDPGSHHAVTAFNLPDTNIMTPLEGAYYLGVRNCCRVGMGNRPQPPFDQHSMALVSMKQVVWSITGDSLSNRNDNGWGDLNEVIRQAKMYPNITGGVLDDFFSEKRRSIFTPERLNEFRNKMTCEVGRKMDLWVVLYDGQLDEPVKAHLDACDVITFWTWHGKNLDFLDRNLERVIGLTPGKRRLAGCYMWNYGEHKPLTVEQMEYQCGKYYEWLKKGDIEGIIFCSNCIADIGLEAVEWTREWINKIARKSAKK
jgi:hypothetical protein